MPTGTNPLTGAGVAILSLRYQMPDGEPAENVFGIHKDSGTEYTDTELTALCTKAVDWWENGDGTHSLKALTSANAALATVVARSLHTDHSPEVELGVGVNGTDAGDDLPNGMTFTVTLRTGLSGRSHRGRLYLCALTKNFLDTDPNKADATHAANAVSAVTGWLLGPHQSPAGFSPSILSRSNNGAFRADIAAFQITNAGFFDLNMDYQRRRAPGHNRGG